MFFLGFLDEKKTIVCSACGEEERLMVKDIVVLKDGVVICPKCAAKVRILYPKDFTWQLEICEYGDEADSDENPVWLDPLNEMTWQDFQAALPKTEMERVARREKYGSDKAFFKVDENSRIIKMPGKGRRVITDEYAITGTVLLGEVGGMDEISVRRKEKIFTRSIKRIEIPSGGLAMEKADSIAEGCYGSIILEGDAPYIYPGDVLCFN